MGTFSPRGETLSAGSLEMNRAPRIRNASLSRLLGGDIQSLRGSRGESRNGALSGSCLQPPRSECFSPFPHPVEGCACSVFCCHSILVVDVDETSGFSFLTSSIPNSNLCLTSPQPQTLDITSQNCSTAQTSLTGILPSSCHQTFTGHTAFTSLALFLLHHHSSDITSLSVSLDFLAPLIFLKPSSWNTVVCQMLGGQDFDIGLTGSTT